jgi:phage FluMu protein Com
MSDPLHATIEGFAAEGYTHVECFCPRCRVIRLRPMSRLPKISLGLTLAQLSQRLRCAQCGGPCNRSSRGADVLGKPQGRRG